MVNYAYTNYEGNKRNSDWFIRTSASYMATDWRYGSALKHKMLLRTEVHTYMTHIV